MADSISYQQPQIPIVSNLTGELLTPEQATDPAYWVSHVRQPVRFTDGVATLAAQGATPTWSSAPTRSLIPMAAGVPGGPGDRHRASAPPCARVAPSPRPWPSRWPAPTPPAPRLDWAAFFKGTAAKRVALPTYPFQRQRYWLSAARAAPATLPRSARPTPTTRCSARWSRTPSGRAAAPHRAPLPAGPPLAGRPRRRRHRPAARHRLRRSWPCGPATSRRGADRRGARPAGARWSIPEQGAVQLQVAVGEPDEQGRREISIHSRPEAAAEEARAEWTSHASGTLSAERPGAARAARRLATAGAEPIDVERPLRAPRRRRLRIRAGLPGADRRLAQTGEEIYAEVSLPEEQAASAERFAIHPALLDAALHAVRSARTARRRACACPSPGAGSRSAPATPVSCA